MLHSLICYVCSESWWQIAHYQIDNNFQAHVAISVQPILQYRIMSVTVSMHITVCWNVMLWQGAATKAWKNEGMALCTINLSTWWGWLFSSTCQSLHSQRKSPTGTHWTRGWIGPRARVNAMKKRKSHASARNLPIIPWLSSLHPSHCT
jgi:hypothetical protein